MFLIARRKALIFEVGNLLLQGFLNSFGSEAIAEYSVGGQLVAVLVYPAMNSFYHAALSFTSQRHGAGKYKDIDKIVGICSNLFCSEKAFTSRQEVGVQVIS